MEIKSIIIKLNRSVIKDRKSSAFVWNGEIELTYDNDKKEAVSLPFHATREVATASALALSQTIIARNTGKGGASVPLQPLQGGKKL
jgi:hypothetical protein